MASYDDSIDGMLKQVFHFSSTVLLANFISMFQGIMVLKLMDPSDYGVWASIMLIYEYGIYFHLGLINGMERSIPFFRGRNEHDRAHRVGGVCKSNLLILVCFGAAILVAVVLIPGRNWSPEVRLGIFAVTLSAFLFLGTQFYMALLKVNQKFRKAGLIQLVISISMLACLVLIWRYRFYGLCFRAVITALFGLVFAAWFAKAYHQKMEFDANVTLYLIRIGFPLMFIGSIALVLFSMDRIIIVSFLGTTLVGYYGICVALFRMMNLFPMAVGQVFAPVMANSYGASASPSLLLKYAVRASLIAFSMSAASSAFLYFFIPFFVRKFLNDYSYGIPAAQITLISGMLVALSVGAGFLLQTIMRQLEYFLVILISAATLFVASVIFISRGFDINGVAWSMVMGCSIYTIGLWVYVFIFCRREKLGKFHTKLKHEQRLKEGEEIV